MDSILNVQHCASGRKSHSFPVFIVYIAYINAWDVLRFGLLGHSDSVALGVLREGARSRHQ